MRLQGSDQARCDIEAMDPGKNRQAHRARLMERTMILSHKIAS